MRIGEYIQLKRQDRDWTLAQLADRAALSVSFISDIEGGRGNPSLTSLESIAKAFDMGAGDLLVEAGYTLRPQTEFPLRKGRIVTRFVFGGGNLPTVDSAFEFEDMD